MTCQVDAAGVEGRLGGLVRGWSVDWRFSEDGSRLTGRLGGDALGRDVDVVLGPQALRGRVGGSVIGQDVELTLEGDPVSGTLQVTGRWGGETIGFDCHLEYDVATGRLQGRLGGEVIGHTVDMQAEPEVPPLLAAFIACCTYHSYLETQPRSGGAAGSNSNS